MSEANPTDRKTKAMSKQQEPKYEFRDGCVFNRASGEMIPLDEPVFVFRARDLQAAKAIRYYATLLARSPDEHWDAVMERVEQFERFTRKHPDRMKEPDTQAPSTPTEDA